MAYVQTGSVRTDGERSATAVKVWRVPDLGMCVKAEVRAADPKDTRRHIYAGPLKLFLSRFPQGA